MFVERWLNNDEDLVASAGLCSTQRTKREDGRDQRAYGNHETVCALFCVFLGIMGDTGVDTSFGRMLSFDLTHSVGLPLPTLSTDYCFALYVFKSCYML
jgi:hypothetical protein